MHKDCQTAVRFVSRLCETLSALMGTFLYGYAIFMSGFLILGPIVKVGLKLAGKYEGTPSPVQFEEFITLPFFLISVVALFGYIQQVAIFNSLFWQIYFVLTLMHAVVGFWLPKQRWLKSELPLKKFVVFNIIGFGIGVPLYYILFSYSFISFPAG